jgi:hypothetical protein
MDLLTQLFVLVAPSYQEIGGVKIMSQWEAQFLFRWVHFRGLLNQTSRVAKLIGKASFSLTSAE